MKSLFIPTLLVGSIALAGCQQLTTTTNKQNGPSMKSIATVQKLSPQEFDEQANNEAAFVLDVHIPEQAHIPGTDAFIPFDKLEENISQLPENKDTPLLVYCRSGGMSAEATQELVEMGYTNVSDLVGGINAWKSVNGIEEL